MQLYTAEILPLSTNGTECPVFRYSAVSGDIDPDKWHITKETLLKTFVEDTEHWLTPPPPVQALYPRDRLFGAVTIRYNDAVGIFKVTRVIVAADETLIEVVGLFKPITLSPKPLPETYLLKPHGFTSGKGKPNDPKVWTTIAAFRI